MLIGELSRRTGCIVETIRFYERIGIMPAPPRSPGGQRIYTVQDEKRLTFIRRGNELGFSLEEVRGMLGMVDGGDYSCADIETITRSHIKDVKRKISDLRKIKKVLEDMARQCAAGVVPECPIVEEMFTPKATNRSSP
jgi:MerR family mercuric resistance operon transcriptional regulator